MGIWTENAVPQPHFTVPNIGFNNIASRIIRNFEAISGIALLFLMGRPHVSSMPG